MGESSAIISEYDLSSQRKKTAETLIESKGEKLYTIAEQVGSGNNPQYFSQWFKKHTGVSPSKYLSEL